MGASDGSETLILHPLDFEDVRGLQVGRIDWGPVVDDGGHDRLEGEEEVFAGTSPVCPRNCLDDVHTGSRLLHDHFGMRAKSELRIQRDP